MDLLKTDRTPLRKMHKRVWSMFCHFFGDSAKIQNQHDPYRPSLASKAMYQNASFNENDPNTNKKNATKKCTNLNIEDFL